MTINKATHTIDGRPVEPGSSFTFAEYTEKRDSTSGYLRATVEDLASCKTVSEFLNSAQARLFVEANHPELDPEEHKAILLAIAEALEAWTRKV